MSKRPTSNKRNLNINLDDYLKDVRDIYAADSITKMFNSLVYGDFGTGKTYSLRTAPKPVLIHSFDPGGTRSVKTLIDKGEILADTRFEDEDAQNPTAYRLWEDTFDALRATDFFNHIGTYVLDSVTTWTESIMNAILKAERRNGQPPQIQDYQAQMGTIRDAIKVMTGLPCNFIATGHIDTMKDDVTGRIVTGPMVTGKMKAKMPLLFDEIYVSLASRTSSGIEYYFLTQNDGRYKARSRLAEEGQLELQESQDWKQILRKTGYQYENKPLDVEAQLQRTTE